MGWTDPRTWNVGEIVTKAIMDLHIKNNLRYLKGLDGVPTVESGLIIDNTDGDEYLQIPSLTTAERDALTPVNGMVIYNETTTEFNKYEAGAWKDLGGGTDHGGLDGLADDDHTQYQKESLLTTQGDIPYATAASTWARLPKGTALQWLRTNAGATAPEWATQPSGIAINSGDYAGDNSANRAIAHGLGVIPKLVTIEESAGTKHFTITDQEASIKYHYNTADGEFAVTAMDATNFYVGNAAGYADSANTGLAYQWVAMG